MRDCARRIKVHSSFNVGRIAMLIRSLLLMLAGVLLSCNAQAQEKSLSPQAAYSAHCANCHGADRKGRVGIPNLADDVWYWGGDAANVEQTIRHGIRTADPQTRTGAMPGFKHNDAELTDANIADLLIKLDQLAGRKVDAQALERAEENWVWCVDCHGKEGRGVQAIGGPNLIDKESLYGNDKKTLALSIAEGRKGVCPGGDGKLNDAAIKALAQWLVRK
jgi:cytochrome c oxidase cbb3-type subunit III